MRILKRNFYVILSLDIRESDINISYLSVFRIYYYYYQIHFVRILISFKSYSNS